MPAMNFPANPILGAEYIFNNTKYIYDGVKWVAQKSNEQNMNQLLDAHKAGVDQHSILGIIGLRAELDSIGSIKTTCLVNALGTGAPNEAISSSIPANIAVNTRYVLPNPFGINTPVTCVVEVLSNGKWANPGWAFTGVGAVHGVCAGYVQGEGVIVQTAKNYLLGSAADIGGLGGGMSAATSLPCRVFVSKMI